MSDPKHLREQARKCRALMKTAIELEVIEQLRVWAVELAGEADEAERRTANRETVAFGLGWRMSDNARGDG
jgi:hypothetical protein